MRQDGIFDRIEELEKENERLKKALADLETKYVNILEFNTKSHKRNMELIALCTLINENLKVPT